MLSLPIFVGSFFYCFELRNASPTDNFQFFCIFVGRFFTIGSFKMLNLQTISRISAFLSVGSPLRRK